MKLAEDGRVYDSYSHVEAARDLDEAGQPQRAFDMLQSAVFWSTLNHNQSIPGVFEIAHSLAASFGWSDLDEYMNGLAKRHNEFIGQHS